MCHCIYLRSACIDLYVVPFAIVHTLLSTLTNFFFSSFVRARIDLNCARLAPIKKSKQTQRCGVANFRPANTMPVIRKICSSRSTRVFARCLIVARCTSLYLAAYVIISSCIYGRTNRSSLTCARLIIYRVLYPTWFFSTTTQTT